MKFCAHCGHSVTLKAVDGDLHQRFACDGCGTVHYDNPKVLVSCAAYFEDRLLMCRRAHGVDHGLWELPTGYVEQGESLEEAVTREISEETGVSIDPSRLDLYAVLSLPRMNQIYVVFRIELTRSPVLNAGTECLSVAMKAEAEVPLDQWAFNGGVCGGPEVIFAEIRTRIFSIRKMSIDNSAMARRSTSSYPILRTAGWG